jgi:dGTPase
VFYLIQNDHITHRVLHVQLASKIARTIGRFLGLNTDLIEAIALGHDIGHTPFGHDGERCLSQICLSLGIGNFMHNLQSVQFLDQVERKGQGLNLCLQTLDGILTHDGEIHNKRLYPEKNKTFEIFEKEIREKKDFPAKQIVPMTMEGCVVRLSDTISYIGRDIEDAIRLKIIRRSDIPRICSNVLGDTNGKIVYRLVTDVVETSHEKEYVGFSHEVSEALKRLKEFNLNRIYFNPKIKTELKTIKELFAVLFERFLSDLENENRNSSLYTGFLENMSEEYIRKHKPEEIVRDFIAGMTDTYFLNQCPENLRPAFRVII